MKWRSPSNSDVVEFGGNNREVPIYRPIPDIVEMLHAHKDYVVNLVPEAAGLVGVFLECAFQGLVTMRT